MPSESKRGSRACLECDRARSNERAALAKAAREHLGLTKRQYTAIYGQSRAAAVRVLEAGNVL